VFTDQTGTYQIAGVTPGRVELEVFYTDLDPQTIAVEASAGQSVEQNVALTSVARYGRPGEVVQLDPFVVASDRETDAQAIATNEQRFAPNIKNVMSTDSLGDVMSSSVGEFLKFIPGVQAAYDNASITGISIRGIGGAMTSFTSDGAPIVSSGISAATGRSFDTNTMALNDISRIEVTKVPTPARPADSLAGSVNVVSKSAFERSKAQLRYGVTFLGNSENVTLHKTPRAYDDRRTAKLLPGFDLDLTLPLGKNFGVVLTALRTARFNEQHISQMTWNSAGTSTGASFARPFLQTHLLADDPRNELRKTIGLKADWRVTRHGVLSISSQWSELENVIGNNRMTSNVGNNGTPTTAGGVPLSFDGTFTQGATGRGSVTLSGFSHRYEQSTAVQKANYRFDDGRWKIAAALSRSSARTTRRHNEHGHFYELAATLRTPVRVSFVDITPDAPGAVQAFDAANRPVDLTDIDNYQLSTATDVPLKKKARIESGSFNVRRRLEFLPVPASLQVGAFGSRQMLDVSSYMRTWNYAGPDASTATPDSPAPYLMRTYVKQDAGFGFGSTIPWISSMRAWKAWQENPVLFTQTAAQEVTAEIQRITNSEFVRETVSAGYVQAETNLLRSRLKLLTGVRYEKT
jgi:TonB-dependent receptor